MKKAWIIGGAILLGVMLLAAAFALGVYTERYGLSREGLNYDRPGAGAVPQGQPGRAQPPGQGQGRQPGGQGPQLPPGLDAPPQVIGRLLHRSPEALELATQDGPRSVLINSETVFGDSEGNRLRLEDLQEGQRLAVYGVMHGGAMTAVRVIVLPPQQPDS